MARWERECRLPPLIREGLCLVNAMHITASVFINDDEPGLHADYRRWLEWLAPFDASPERYHHNRSGEDNGDAHQKRQIMGREVVVAVTKGKLDFGPWGFGAEAIEAIKYERLRHPQPRVQRFHRNRVRRNLAPVMCAWSQGGMFEIDALKFRT